ncbi:unnamed protein product, partial [Polarella glacialis]
MIAEYLNAQSGLPLFVLELHPHSLAPLDDRSGLCAVCRCPVAGRGAAATRAAAAVAAAVDFIGFGDVQLEPREEDANDGEDERHDVARPSVSQSSVIDEVVAGGFRCAACEFFLCDACSQPYQLPSSRASASSSGG